MAKSIRVSTLLRRLDDAAYEQICEQAARLADENERLRRELSFAIGDADSWREDALRMMEELCAATHAKPGLTAAGALVTVPVTEAVHG